MKKIQFQNIRAFPLECNLSKHIVKENRTATKAYITTE